MNGEKSKLTKEKIQEQVRKHILKNLQLSEENVLRLEKGRRGVLHLIFGRTGVFLVMLLMQVFMMFSLYYWLEQYVSWFYAFNTLLTLGVGIHILNRKGDSSMKMTWMIVVMGMPVFGTVMYIWFQLDVGHRLLHKRLKEVIHQTQDILNTNPETLEKLRTDHRDLYELSVYMDRFGGYPVYEGCRVTYFPLGEDKFEDMVRELERARDFIFLEYFIVDEGYMWGRILEILRRKAAEGVEVRVLYDGTNAVYKLPYNYPKKLQALGIRCKMFAPLKPAMSTHYNNRDHRKILVIDGHTAYTGGVNLADEYINKKEIYGHWKDTAVKVEGEAARSFALMFLQMWNVDEKTERYDEYLNREYHFLPKPEGYVMPYGDSPLDDERVGEMVYMDILNRAERYVHIMTPYLILDGEMLSALTFAAKRGVEVQIILPYVPDKEYAFAIAKTYYKQLMEAGVEIYEYLPGFVHAKVFSSDSHKAVVGTINLDYRSLYHHFECGLYMQDVEEIEAIERDFLETRSKCRKMTPELLKKEPFFRKITGLILKVVAPLM